MNLDGHARSSFSGGNLGGNLEITSIEFLDLDKLVEYTIHLGNATTAAKAGFHMEQHKDRSMADQDYLERLRSLRPVKPHYMIHSERKTGRLVGGGNLVWWLRKSLRNGERSRVHPKNQRLHIWRCALYSYSFPYRSLSLLFISLAITISALLPVESIESIRETQGLGQEKRN